jgi:raffinose/stachyose/melibiose transport system permease protein
MKKRSALKGFIIILLCLLQMIPIYITITVSLKPQTDVSSYWKLPSSPFLQNFLTAFRAGNMFRAYGNTFIITVCATLLVLLLSTMAAYPLARYPSRFNKAVRTFFLSIMMVPALALLVPIYVLLLRLGGISKYQGIVPVHVAFNLPLAIYMFSNFIKTIPAELDEAALIDGCSVYSIFYRIIFPMLKPVIVSVVILTAVPVWNDFQYSVYFLHRPQMRVITLSVASFFQQSGSNPNTAAAAALMGIVPVVILYIVLQKHFIKGMVDGAIK